MSIQVAASCVHHPSRSAVGICVSCRARVCAECVTKIDGINHCVDCYARRAAQVGEANQARAEPIRQGAARVAAVGLLVSATLLYWLLLAVGLPGG